MLQPSNELFYNYKITQTALMYKNFYLEIYKNKVSKSSNMHELFYHFTHMYFALGTIMQDIQILVTNILSSPKKQVIQGNYEQVQPIGEHLQFLSQELEKQKSRNFDSSYSKEPRKKIHNSSAEKGRQPSYAQPQPHRFSTLSFQELFKSKSKPERHRQQLFKIPQVRQSQLPKYQDIKQENFTQNEDDFFQKLFARKKKSQ